MASMEIFPDLVQDCAIVPSDLVSSQNGVPLLVHPMLPHGIGSLRDAATLPYHPRFTTTTSLPRCFLASTQHGRWKAQHRFLPLVQPRELNHSCKYRQAFRPPPPPYVFGVNSSKNS